jgi:cruciform cutting endonuclease 1
MRLTSPSFKEAEAALAWLSTMRSEQLRGIAEATGVRLGGPKPALLDRLRRELPRSVFLPGRSPPSREDGDGALSILSVDLGIQNLAFAHLLVPRPVPGGAVGATTTTSNSWPKQLSFGPDLKPRLNAWHRLDISALPRAAELGHAVEKKKEDGAEQGRLLLPETVIRTLHDSRRRSTKKGKSQSVVGLNEDEAEKKKGLIIDAEGEAVEEEKEEEEDQSSVFRPDIYAGHAYTLLTSLIAAYRPTHILMERQRFRTARSSSVQEWTLRVGVFEGILYGVLHTLQQVGHCMVVDQQMIDPARVARYWQMDLTPKPKKMKANRKARPNSPREVKKMKIDLVAGWLRDATETTAASSSLSSSASSYSSPSGAAKISIPPASAPLDVRNVVDAYLLRCLGRRGDTSAHRMDKLDDLADCLLQGLTWLDWHAKRHRFVTEGPGGL